MSFAAWRDIVTVAALDCAHEDNNPLCREYEIMRYPDVRYFAPNEKPKSLGVDVEKGKHMDALRENLITRLQKEQQEGRGTNWPNITPYRSSEIKNIWEDVPSTVKHCFFIFEDAKSFLGTEIILDLHNVTSLQIRRVTSDNSLLCLMHKITKFPTIIVFNRDESQNRLNLRLPTREGTRKSIKEYLSTKGTNIEISDIPDEHPVEWMKSDVPSNPDRVPKPVLETNSKPATKNPPPDLLHQADLESALKFSIGHEIPMIKTIEGERMKALKNYTDALAAYFPMKRGNPMFLNTLRFVIRSKESITGADFRILVRSTEQEMSPVYSEKSEWIGCKGSKPGFRGYPCGLWTLFHTLTVNFAGKHEEHPDMDVTQILGTIHGYVKNFFGCADCAEHFITMAAKNKIFEVNTADENILWLWRAHNEVNARLAGDDTEDPMYQKVQYPTSEQCPDCRDENTGDWDEARVLTYLKRKYSYSGIKYDSSTKSYDQKPRPVQERLSFNKDNVTQRKFGWDFTIFDISICVVLYVTSAAILILVCIKFAVKRSYKKK